MIGDNTKKAMRMPKQNGKKANGFVNNWLFLYLTEVKNALDAHLV